MNKHFYVRNRRGVITSSALLGITIILFSLSLAKKLSGGSFVWTIPLTVSVILFILALILLVSVLTAGIDVNGNMVIFADASGQGGKQPQFSLENLKKIKLHNMNGEIEDPKHDDLMGGRIVFTLEDGTEKIYYPVSITYKQYEKIRDGLIEIKKEIFSR